MKKILMFMLAFVPVTMWAQDNTWERPEEEEVEVKEQKTNPDAKYLRGAVPEVDGKVVFSKTIEAPGKSAADIFRTIRAYMQKMGREKNQINNQFLVNDSTKYELGGNYEEWLVFKKTALVLDQTRFMYVLEAQQRDPQRLKAEGWITDNDAVNKKNTKLYPRTGKFRRKTIDRKDFLFNKIESLLK